MFLDPQALLGTGRQGTLSKSSVVDPGCSCRIRMAGFSDGSILRGFSLYFCNINPLFLLRLVSVLGCIPITN
jgi:hypothetical protein